MNVIGKVFLFAVFIMSLMLMTFAGAIFVSHVNWRDEVKRLPEECVGPQEPGYEYQLQLAKKEKERLTAEITELKKNVSASEKARDQVLAKLQTAVVSKDRQLRELQREKSEREEKLRTQTAELEAVTADLRTAREKVETLVKQVAEQQQKVDSQVDRSAELSAQLAESKSFLAIAEERKAQLERQLNNARLLLNQSGLDIDSLPKDRVPTIDGQVVAVAAGSIEVSLGSDDGLQKGHLLEVYRGGEYVGRAVVTGVRPDRAIARIIEEYARGIVQRGDRVTTRLKA